LFLTVSVKTFQRGTRPMTSACSAQTSIAPALWIQCPPLDTLGASRHTPVSFSPAVPGYSPLSCQGQSCYSGLVATPIVQFNRKAREARKGTLCIQDGGREIPERTFRNFSFRTVSQLDESWRVFAIFASLAVRHSNSTALPSGENSG
jgi:hypothetical protein